MNRSWRRSSLASLATRNLASWAVVGGATSTMLLALWIPFLRRLFRFGPVSLDDALAATLGGALCLAWFEILKRLRARWLGT